MNSVQSLLSRFTSLRKTKPSVALIKINGNISTLTSYQVFKALTKARKLDAKALALVINSQGGSTAQSYIILQQIQNFCQQQNIQLLTFGEDAATSGSFILLSAGNKVYVDPVTLVGNMGTTIKYSKIGEVYQYFYLEPRYFTTSNELLANRLDDQQVKNDNDIAELTQLNAHYNEKLINVYSGLRKSKLKMTEEDIQNNLYQGEIYTGRQAVELGLSDEIGNYQETLNKLYPGVNIKDLTMRTNLEKYRDSLKSVFNSLLGMQNIIFLRAIKEFNSKFSQKSNENNSN